MKNISTGTGLALLAAAIVAFPLVNQLCASERTAHGGVALPVAVTSTAMAQVEPTIVWYGISNSYQLGTMIVRAWSNGRIEGLRGEMVNSGPDCYWSASGPCTGWRVISDPNQGYSSSADMNFDQQVDGTDLGLLLAMWGPAPRHDIPPSDCPLNLINP